MKRNFLLVIILLLYSLTCHAVPTPKEILQNLKLGKFQTLNRLIKSQQYAYERGARNELEISRTMDSFQSSNDGVEEQLNKWVAQYPEDYPAYLARGSYFVHIAALHRGEKYISETKAEQIKNLRRYHAAAFEDFNKVLSIRPRAIYAYSMLLRINASTGSWGEFGRLVDDGFKIDPASYLLHRQILFKLQPKWGGSEAAVRKWTDEQLSPRIQKNPLLKALLGYPDFVRADMSRKNPEKAEGHYSRAIELSEGNYYAGFLRQRGQHYYFNGQYALALKDLNKAIEQYPFNVEALYIRGRTLDDMNLEKEALVDLDLALSLDQYDPYILRARSYLYRDLKNYTRALDDIDASLKYGAYDANNWIAKGYLHSQTKDYQNAQRAFSKATELAQDNRAAWYELGISQYKLFSCDFIPSLKTYLRLCKGKKCEKQLIDWSESVIKTAIDQGYCYKTATGYASKNK